MDEVIVVDTETTGDNPETAGVCEFASVPVFTKRARVDVRWAKAWSSYVNPGFPIGPETRAVHHISNEDVKDFPDLKAIIKRSKLKPVVFCAHNAQFDKQFIGPFFPDVPWICTYRCALHLYPDAPNHKNQTLRYYLGTEPPGGLLAGLAPHRAQYDAVVTAYILAHMLKEKTVEELIELTTQPALLKRINFGQHRGKEWKEVPTSFLQWMLSRDFKEDEMFTAKYHLRQRRGVV